MSPSEEITYKNEERGLRVSLEMMQHNLKMQYDSLDSFKSTARSVLSASSIIFAILGTLHLFDVKPDSSYTAIYQIGIVLTLILYLIEVICCVLVLSPTEYHGPILSDWDILYQTFMDKKEVDLLRAQLSAYLEAHSKNRQPLDRAQRLVLYASILLPTIVILSYLLSLIPRSISP